MSTTCDVCGTTYPRGFQIESMIVQTEEDCENLDLCSCCKADLKIAYQVIGEECNELERIRRAKALENLISVKGAKG